MSRALVTDLYELKMAASYLRRRMTAPATFSLFVRDLPPDWGFLVACGLQSCLEFLESFRFADEDLDYLDRELGYPKETIEAFARLRFTGNVRAIREGRMVFAQEPLLEVTAPLPEAQLVETYLLNQVTYQTAVASKAARCRLVASDASLIDFSLRRVHGSEAGIGVARATAIAGFSATSNVEAARRLGIPAAGTMAHSYIEAFPNEIEAFRALAEDFPDRLVLLVDTYDTEHGVRNAIAVAGELAAGGRNIAAIRLDSVYKLVEYEGRAVAKLSTAKRTLPGPKQVWRRPEMAGDIIGLASEADPDDAEPLLVEVMKGGRPVNEETLADAIERCAAELAALPANLRGLAPGSYPVAISPALERLSDDVAAAITERELGG